MINIRLFCILILIKIEKLNRENHENSESEYTISELILTVL